MLTTLSEFDRSVVPNFEDFNNIITFNNNIVLVNNIKAITQIKSNSIRFPKFGYNYEYMIDVNIPVTVDIMQVNNDSSIKNIFFYNDSLMIGYKLIHIKTYLIRSAIHQLVDNPIFRLEFNIDVSSCDMLVEDDLFLIRTLLLQHI